MLQGSLKSEIEGLGASYSIILIKISYIDGDDIEQRYNHRRSAFFLFIRLLLAIETQKNKL